LAIVVKPQDEIKADTLKHRSFKGLGIKENPKDRRTIKTIIYDK